MNGTLYDALGVHHDASFDEIKKVYRKMAVEHHPDKGGDEAKFKQIGEAYSTLSNPQKRHEYDMELNAPRFDQMFNEDVFANGFMGSFFRPNKPPQQKTQIVKTVQLSMKEAYTGCKKIVEVECSNVCDCSVECKECHGVGTVNKMKVAQMGQNRIMQTFTETCGMCKGAKVNVTNNDCSACNNTRKQNKTVRVTLNIPERSFSDIKSVMKHPTRSNLDIIINVKINFMSGYSRQNNDLLYTKEIALVDAILGNVFSIPHPSGEEIVIDYTEKSDVIKTGTIVSVHNKGLRQNSDLLVRFVVLFPEKRALNASMQDTFLSVRENLNKIITPL